MNEDKASRYHRLKRRAALVSLVATTALLLALLAGGLSLLIRDASVGLTGAASGSMVTVAVYTLLLAIVLQIAGLPASCYSTFVLERRYGLSSETFRAWTVDRIKAAILSFAVALAGAQVVYMTLARWPRGWWLASAAVAVGATIVLTGIAPVLLLPIFYRFRPLERDPLRARLVALCARAGTPVLGAYEWGLGRKTRRANAALVGAGRTRRILLSDTLIDDYSDDEIEGILAHELAHHVHGDIRMALAIEAVVMVLAFGAAALALARLWPRLSLAGPTDVAGLPLLLLAGGAISLLATPLVNAISRHKEYRADRFAIAMTNRPDALVSALRRLAVQNLAELRPSRVTVWFFHTHPPIERRIAALLQEAKRSGA